MEHPDPAFPSVDRSALEARIAEAPQLVVEYVRLARLLEDAGDREAAASALQTAQFFLPNGPTIQEGLRRLSSWLDTTRTPISVPTAAPPSKPDVETTEEPDEAGKPEAKLEDNLDQLIEGLGKARLGQPQGGEAPPEDDWSDDDGLVTTETLAQIFISQNQFAEALSVYERLLLKESDPGRMALLAEKAAELREKLRESN
jgi:tetratricopeptide (TPR) repeat protein